MHNKIFSFFQIILLLLPISLITGPAIPDITITFSGIFFLIFIHYKNIYKSIYKDNFFLISIFFWIYLILISFFAENKDLSFKESLIFIRLLLIPIFIIYWYSVDSKFLIKILTLVFICEIFVSADTLFQFLNYETKSGFGKDIFGFESNWYGRLTGPFGDELIPGAYLSRFAFIGLAYIFIELKKHKFNNIYTIIYLLFLGLAIFASGERMALATYLLGLGFLVIFFTQKRKIIFISLILLISSIFITKQIHPFYNDYKIIESTPYHLGLKVEKQFSCDINSNEICKKIYNLQPSFYEVIKNFKISAYGEIYNLSLNIFKDHKLLGAGLNNFTYLCKNDDRYSVIINKYVCVSHPHNIYLQWLVEAGILGLFFFISYIFFLFYKILANNKNEYAILSITPILVLFWPIMSTGSILKNWNGVSIFFIIGVCLILSKFKTKN